VRTRNGKGEDCDRPTGFETVRQVDENDNARTQGDHDERQAATLREIDHLAEIPDRRRVRHDRGRVGQPKRCIPGSDAKGENRRKKRNVGRTCRPDECSSAKNWILPREHDTRAVQRYVCIVRSRERGGSCVRSGETGRDHDEKQDSAHRATL